MNACEDLDPVPFNDPESTPDTQVAIGMVLDLRRDVEKQEKFWKYFACASLLAFSAFLFFAWSSGLNAFQIINEDVNQQTELRHHINSLEFRLYQSEAKLAAFE